MSAGNQSAHKELVPKPTLSFLQIFNMSFGFLGIQFAFALQNGNASRILRTFGADVEHLSWFWLAAPLVGPGCRYLRLAADSRRGTDRGPATPRRSVDGDDRPRFSFQARRAGRR